MPVLDDDGKYYIYKSGLRVGDENLAITFQGEDQPVTVEKLVSDGTQIWMVEYSELVDNQLAIIPVNEVLLQATWGADQTVNVSWSPDSLWIVEEANDGYVILNGDRTAEWGVTRRMAGEKVALQGLDGEPPTQQWTFQKA